MTAAVTKPPTPSAPLTAKSLSTSKAKFDNPSVNPPGCFNILWYIVLTRDSVIYNFHVLSGSAVSVVVINKCSTVKCTKWHKLNRKSECAELWVYCKHCMDFIPYILQMCIFWNVFIFLTVWDILFINHILCIPCSWLSLNQCISSPTATSHTWELSITVVWHHCHRWPRKSRLSCTQTDIKNKNKEWSTQCFVWEVN